MFVLVFSSLFSFYNTLLYSPLASLSRLWFTSCFFLRSSRCLLLLVVLRLAPLILPLLASFRGASSTRTFCGASSSRQASSDGAASRQLSFLGSLICSLWCSPFSFLSHSWSVLSCFLLDLFFLYPCMFSFFLFRGFLDFRFFGSLLHGKSASPFGSAATWSTDSPITCSFASVDRVSSRRLEIHLGKRPAASSPGMCGFLCTLFFWMLCHLLVRACC